MAIWLALAVMPRVGDSLILGSETLREKLNTEVIKQLMNTTVTSRGGMSNTEPVPPEEPAMPPEIIGVRHVAVAMKAV